MDPDRKQEYLLFIQYRMKREQEKLAFSESDPEPKNRYFSEEDF